MEENPELERIFKLVNVASKIDVYVPFKKNLTEENFQEAKNQLLEKLLEEIKILLEEIKMVEEMGLEEFKENAKYSKFSFWQLEK